MTPQAALPREFYSVKKSGSARRWLRRSSRNEAAHRTSIPSAALDLEISKVRQYAALELNGIATPRTVLVAGRQQILPAAERHFRDQPVILKPNRGGKGLGVQLFHTREALAAYVEGPNYVAPVDGLQLLQE